MPPRHMYSYHSVEVAIRVIDPSEWRYFLVILAPLAATKSTWWPSATVLLSALSAINQATAVSLHLYRLPSRHL